MTRLSTDRSRNTPQDDLSGHERQQRLWPTVFVVTPEVTARYSRSTVRAALGRPQC
jgi:hypothetical protein